MKEIKNIISSFTQLKMYSIKEKCETAKTPGEYMYSCIKKKTVTSLKFKTVFAPEIQLYLHRNDNS